MLGFLLINKAEGWTSHDVVAKLRGVLGTKRIGHAGTLDPLATGLLLIAVGPATRFLQYLALEPKVYETTLQFGITTNTFDQEGEVTAQLPVPADLEARLLDILPDFVGEIQQLPPMYSAVKKAGKPLYAYARKGEEVEREFRTAFVSEIEMLEVQSPFVKMRITCSGGTYVRTLAHDFGQKVGCGAHVADLVRTQVGDFHLQNARLIEEVDASQMISIATALAPMSVVRLNETQVEHVLHGRVVRLDRSLGPTVALADTQGNVIAIGTQQGPVYQPECVVPQSSHELALHP